ncbi:MAG: DUF3277 family protein [Candidatus Tectomicrobia bacterium]|nr:DUF3277 family protein [Candidatus Tectomicrobia bacterium]
MTTRIYDANEVQISFAGVPVEGYADGDFITITHASDAFSSVVGTDGAVARSKTMDNRADIELRLMNTSPTNAALSAIYQADKNSPGGAGVGAFLCVDLSGTSLYAAGNCWIKRAPDPVFGREANERVWLLEVDALQDFTGGNL